LDKRTQFIAETQFYRGFWRTRNAPFGMTGFWSIQFSKYSGEVRFTGLIQLLPKNRAEFEENDYLIVARL
jgi:hypothetical protein